VTTIVGRVRLGKDDAAVRDRSLEKPESGEIDVVGTNILDSSANLVKYAGRTSASSSSSSTWCRRSPR